MTVTVNQPAALDGQSAGLNPRPRESIAAPDSLYIPSLDGIRAISFFLVFFSHIGLGGVVPGGFGVSIFFLLSGFLITTLLRAEFARYQRISLSSFYLRRVLRILPPLYVSLALAALLGYPDIPFAGTLSQVLQVSNYYWIFASDPRTMKGTAVLWSLAVEEHFYLIFPLLYLWMCGRFSFQRQALILLALCGAALAWRCVLHFHFHAAFVHTYYASDTRFDSILFGCLFAVVANPVFNDPSHARLLRWMGWLLPLCLVVLLGTFLVRGEGFRETLRYSLQGLALIPIFIAAIYYQKSWPVRFLNLRPMRFLGVLSYSLYLCHHIILEKFDSVWTGNAFLKYTLALTCALCFATLVHYWVERPAAKLRKRLLKARKAVNVDGTRTNAGQGDPGTAT